MKVKCGNVSESAFWMIQVRALSSCRADVVSAPSYTPSDSDLQAQTCWTPEILYLRALFWSQEHAGRCAASQSATEWTSPGTFLNDGGPRLMGKYPSFLALGWGSSEVRSVVSQASQHNCVPIAPCDSWLDNTPFISLLLFPISFPYSFLDVPWDYLSNKWQN